MDRGAGMARIKVTVERIGGYCNLPVMVGDSFCLENSKLTIPDGKFVCMWALQSMMPIFPIFAEQDKLAADHWISTVKHFCCPDPKGQVIYRLERISDDRD